MLCGVLLLYVIGVLGVGFFLQPLVPNHSQLSDVRSGSLTVKARHGTEIRTIFISLSATSCLLIPEHSVRQLHARYFMGDFRTGLLSAFEAVLSFAAIAAELRALVL